MTLRAELIRQRMLTIYCFRKDEFTYHPYILTGTRKKKLFLHKERSKNIKGQMQEKSLLSDTFGSAQGCRLSLRHLLLTGGVLSAEGNSFQTFSTWQYRNNAFKLCWEISPSFQVLLIALFGVIIHVLSLHR